MGKSKKKGLIERRGEPSEISSREACNHLILDLGDSPECSRSRKVSFPERGSS